MTLEERLFEVERNLAIYKAGEEARQKHLQKIENALFGKNGESGLVDDMRDLKHFKNQFVKVTLWFLGLIVAPILGTIGFFIIKILTNMDQILKFIEASKAGY